jgi:Tfp pilus assembly protein PilP
MSNVAMHLPKNKVRAKYISHIFLCLPLSCFHSVVVAEGSSLVLETQNLLPKIEAYYQAIDKQLNKRSTNSQRDPFANTLIPAQNIQQQGQKNPAFTRNNQLFEKRNKTPPEEKSIPILSFKGILQQGNKKLALLNIEGQGTFVVKEGDKVGVQQVGSSAAVLHILEINELNLIVETGSYKEKMVVQ